MFIYLIVIYAFDELHLVRQLSFEQLIDPY